MWPMPALRTWAGPSPPPAAPSTTPAWSTDHGFRHHCLGQLKAGLDRHMDELRTLIAAETGAPLGICGRGGPQCDLPIGFIDYTLEALPKFEWRRDIASPSP